MSAKTSDAVSLHHVIVVGGTPAEWAATGDEQWAARLGEMGKVADHVGAQWLVVRPFGPGLAGGSGVAEVAATPPAPPASAPDRTVTIGGCQVTAQSQPDGRQRLTMAVAALHAAGEPIDEASIASLLNAPAAADPDLVVVVGAKHRLPQSLAWELAYSELVFVDLPWQHFGPRQLEDAIASFAHRHRRFGGID
ncbi:MAG: undecaprenyl diphosphate synthase family protein [Actinomycetota bacterium]|nr:undecaprenyl diphosphate synthase family protein [Actinomycetota bacterium]